MVKNSFFSRVQSWFDASYHGRYLAYVLAEIGKLHPDVIRELICAATPLRKRALPRPALEPEYTFRGAAGPRRADLALYARPDDDEVSALVEIKYRDKLLPATDVKPAQLEDYLHWRRQAEGREVLVLTRERLRHEGLPTLTWTEAARLLRRHQRQSDLVRMLIEHLEEEGIVMQQIDAKALVGFLKRLLCSSSGAGVLAGNLEGPQELSTLMRNVKLLSARFNPAFKEAWRDAGKELDAAKVPEGSKEATVDISVMPRVDTRFDRQRMVDDEGMIHWKARNGGDVFVRAQHSLGNGKQWLRVGYGFWLCIDKSVGHQSSNLPHTYLYAWADGGFRAGEGELSSEQKVRFDLITGKAADSMDKIEAIAAKHVLQVLEQLEEHVGRLTPKQRLAVKKLKGSLNSTR